MTPEILEWAGKAITRHGILRVGRTLELGSYNVNGSLRQFFTGTYVGVDQTPGPGVDVVAKVQDLGPEWSQRYDTVVCTEMLEHDLEFWDSLQRMYKSLYKGGYLILTTCGFDAALHDYPSDFYRFTTDAIDGLLTWAGFKVIEVKEFLVGNQAPWDTIVAVGRK
jgi:hypothetical protein